MMSSNSKYDENGIEVCMSTSSSYSFDKNEECDDDEHETDNNSNLYNTNTNNTTTISGSFVPQRCTTLHELQNIQQIETYATRYAMAPSLGRYVNSGAEDDESVVANREGFVSHPKYRLRPRILAPLQVLDPDDHTPTAATTAASHRDVDTTTTILQGRVTVSCPICIAPVAGARAVHPGGEIAIATAAAQAGVVYTIPSTSSVPLSTIVTESTACYFQDTTSSPHQQQQQQYPNTTVPPPPLFFQFDPHTTESGRIDREHTQRVVEYLVSGATTAGSRQIVAIVLTCDRPKNTTGNREQTERNPQWKHDSLTEFGGFPKSRVLDGLPLPPPTDVDREGHHQHLLASSSSSSSIGKGTMHLTWKDIQWMKEMCHTRCSHNANSNLAIIIKGVMTGEDAILAAQIGVDAIIVSNHGGRQLDGTASTIEVVDECVTALAAYYEDASSKNKQPVPNTTRMEVYVDGGIRRGKDIAKCLALGAHCVFVGRPILWGLACGGPAGVFYALQVLQTEFRTVLQLLGCRSVKDLNKTHVIPPTPSEAVRAAAANTTSNNKRTPRSLLRIPATVTTTWIGIGTVALTMIGIAVASFMCGQARSSRAKHSARHLQT